MLKKILKLELNELIYLCIYAFCPLSFLISEYYENRFNEQIFYDFNRIIKKVNRWSI